MGRASRERVDELSELGDGLEGAVCGVSHGGDREANRALHMIAVCRLRHCARSRAYAQRRIAEGKTKKEIIRCLKRYIARETYHALRADLADLSQPSPPYHTTAVRIICGAGPIGRSRRRA